MRTKWTTALAIAGLIAGTSLAASQSDTGPASPSGGAGDAVKASPSLTIDTDVQTEFRTYVTTEKIVPVEVQTEVVVDSTLPETVVLEPVPEVIVTRAPTLQGHRYALIGGRIVVVEPSSTRIVTVID